MGPQRSLGAHRNLPGIPAPLGAPGNTQKSPSAPGYSRSTPPLPPLQEGARASFLPGREAVGSGPRRNRRWSGRWDERAAQDKTIHLQNSYACGGAASPKQQERNQRVPLARRLADGQARGQRGSELQGGGAASPRKLLEPRLPFSSPPGSQALALRWGSALDSTQEPQTVEVGTSQRPPPIHDVSACPGFTKIGPDGRVWPPCLARDS